MQVGEKGLPLSEQGNLARLGLLDAEHQLGLGEDRCGVGRDPRALSGEVVVADRAALARAGLDDHLVALLGQLPDPDRRDRDPVLVRLDLRGYTNDHPEASDPRTPDAKRRMSADLFIAQALLLAGPARARFC